MQCSSAHLPWSLVGCHLLSFASWIHPLYPGPESFVFKSHCQAELMQSYLTNDHMLAVMPTRSGKSLAFFGAPLLNPSSMFVVIIPFIALMDDMERRLAACPGIRGGKWFSDTDPINDQLIIIPAHEAGMEKVFPMSRGKFSSAPVSLHR